MVSVEKSHSNRASARASTCGPARRARAADVLGWVGVPKLVMGTRSRNQSQERVRFGSRGGSQAGAWNQEPGTRSQEPEPGARSRNQEAAVSTPRPSGALPRRAAACQPGRHTPRLRAVIVAAPRRLRNRPARAAAKRQTRDHLWPQPVVVVLRRHEQGSSIRRKTFVAGSYRAPAGGENPR